ncbi:MULTISPECIES: terminase large subunit [Clostridium]|jgi:phage terminase large subunit-like protein|uniref:terminase large subunit n=1 Tax=Clostridium TaxID=1485 RepID=UPI0006913D7A|nr:terminase TerL endonuclease subunit [Clostridium saudiense]
MFDKRVYDLPVYKYMQDVTTGRVIACKELIILCKKLLNDIEKSKDENYPFYFDVSKSIAIDGFIKQLKFTEGRKIGQAIKLARFQDFIVKSIFCWREKENSNIVRFNDCLILLPRKQGKSFICAILGIVAMMIEANAEVANGAVALSQAKIIVTQAQRLIRSNAKLAKHFKIYKSYIEFVGSTFKPVSSNALDGANYNVVLLDESNATSRELMESMTSGFAQRASYQSYYLTTEYSVSQKTGWFDELKETGVKAIQGIIDNERILPIIYKLDNAEEVHNPDNWIKANPIIEEIGDKFWRDSYAKAKEVPSLMKNFLIKNMNVPQAANDEDTYLDMDKWKKCSVDEINWKGKEVYIGVDLSKTTDLTSVSIVSKDNNGEILVNSHAFLPEETLTNGKRREKIDYRLMEQLGYCTITDGGIVNYDVIEEYIRSLENKYGFIIKGVCFDPYNGLSMMASLAKDYNVIEIKQYTGTLSPATKDFREKVYTEKVKYEKNMLLDWCVSNAITLEDSNGNEKLDKKKSKNRIDMIAAVIFAYVEAMKEQEIFDIDSFFVL